jgi:hypothetical protein
VYNQTNVGENEIWLTNPADFRQEYQGLILTLNKRFSNNWQLNTSITYSKAESFNQGSYSFGGFAGGSSIIALYNLNYGKDPNDWINADGPAVQDRRWIFKLSASYNFPLDILAGVYFSYHTGRPLPTFVRVYPDQGMRQILAEPRGAERFDSLTMLDFRVSKAFLMGSRVRFEAMFDIFNVFNIDTFTYFHSFNLWALNYMFPSEIPRPRRLQLGLKLSF